MKSTEYVLSIDLGTSSCKLSVVDASGSVAATASAGYDTYSEKPGWAEQNPEDWLVAVSEASGRMLSFCDIDPHAIAAIVPTSAAHIGVLADNVGKSLRRAIIWSDQRSAREVEELNRLKGNLIFTQTNNQVSTTWTLPHFLWIKRHHPEIWGRIRHVSFSKDFLVYHLTGNWTSDFSTAVSSMLCNAGTGTWSEELAAMASLDISLLPEILPAGEISGTLNKNGARLLGLPSGIPVLCGALDSAMETYGAGARKPGDYVIRIGTAGGIHVIKQTPNPVGGLLTYPYLIDDLWYSQAGTNSAGSSITWAVETEGFPRTPEGYVAFDNLADQAPPGCEGLIFHPYLSGERTPYWNSDLRGTFSGVSFRHGKAHFARAVLEGVACSLYDALLALGDGDKLPATIGVVGGGGSDKVLMQILSTLMDRKLLAMKDIDSSYGAALYGLHTLGRGKKSGVFDGTTYVPEAENGENYEKTFTAYSKYAKQLLLLYAGGDDGLHPHDI
ncbi:hypothetical protein B4O97_04950 [Marispirochaeta aestuarii]|uniref:Xylulokinase n=1 Tax=Marispirochaeta aestuarii TaxID=1963862 RepID=A0A1Y1S0T1_9SPIO|nr:FGGY family carbohydrate kinase [Marispirochaeta aestuarii]ORC36975.1 hypothetical protein B4O97_04950 [Marispirochaeta aestuarii]